MRLWIFIKSLFKDEPVREAVSNPAKMTTCRMDDEVYVKNAEEPDPWFISGSGRAVRKNVINSTLEVIYKICSQSKAVDKILELQFHENRKYIAYSLSIIFQETELPINLVTSKYYKVLVDYIWKLDGTSPIYEVALKDSLFNLYREANIEQSVQVSLYADYEKESRSKARIVKKKAEPKSTKSSISKEEPIKEDLDLDGRSLDEILGID